MQNFNAFAHPKSSSGLVSLSLLASFSAAALLSGCGFLDAYAPREKRCKAFCENEKSSEDQKTPFNFELTYWNQTTPRSQLDPATELTPLLKSNPFKLVANALKTASDDLNEAKQTLANKSETAQATCLKEVFTAPLKKSQTRSELSLDYGRCVDIAKLQERLNANRNTAKDGKLKVIELDSALYVNSDGQLPLNNGSDALLGANTGLDLMSVLPFRAVRSSELTDPTQPHNFKLHFVRGSVQGTAIEKASSPTVLKKSWGLLYAGLDANQPLQLEWDSGQNTLRLTGSVATLSAAFQRTTNQTQWDGFGYSREFIFAGFTLSGSALELNSQLGWSEQVNMSGSYFLRVNGDLVDAGGQNSRLFHMKASGRPCTLDVGLVTGFQGETPVEQALGQISLCATN